MERYLKEWGASTLWNTKKCKLKILSASKHHLFLHITKRERCSGQEGKGKEEEEGEGEKKKKEKEGAVRVHALAHF